MDAETTKQIPNISILYQDIVRIELYTKQLKGLSFRDLELATIIDSFDLEKYKLIPLVGQECNRAEMNTPPNGALFLALAMQLEVNQILIFKLRR